MTSTLALPAGALPGGTVPPPPPCSPPATAEIFQGWQGATWPLGPGGTGGTELGVPCVSPPPSPQPAATPSEQMGRARGYI